MKTTNRLIPGASILGAVIIGFGRPAVWILFSTGSYSAYLRLVSTRLAHILAFAICVTLVAPATRGGTHVVAWGNTNQWVEVPPPADLTNAVAIVSGVVYDLALKSDGTVIA